MKYKYFSCDPNGSGLMLHETEDDAKQAAVDALNYERSEAYDGWDDNVELICWGELKQCVKETLCRPKEDDDYVSGDCDFYAEYELLDVN